MPFYNYRCNRCETKFEVLATVEEMEKKLIPCPGCGSRDLTRVYERAAVSLMSKTACEQERSACCCCNKNCPNAGAKGE
ncbi:MAG: FmdB family zinc ribbon protein [Eubacteriales bacterium]|nr:FmdB family zinc ribbon protein [Eubacteriales bacterium]MDY5016870.1 FmdB family zinc ribbon protein [Eubacteriales bacterium]